MNPNDPQDQRGQKVRAILDEAQAVIVDDHVVYTSTKHGSAYVNKDDVYPEWMNIEFLCDEIAKDFSGDRIEMVVGPVQGATVLAYATARALRFSGKPQWVYAEKETITPSQEEISAMNIPERFKGMKIFFETGEFVLKRGYDKRVAGKRVLVVEDVLNTGGTVKKLVELLRRLGAEVVGVAALVNRGNVTPEMIGSPAKLVSLLDVQMDAWSEEECKASRLCFKKVPINQRVGKGKEFLAREREAAQSA